VCLEIVKECVYLGLLLQSNVRFGRTQRLLAHQGRKAMYRSNLEQNMYIYKELHVIICVAL
jgi:hypothetical protein